MDRELFKQLVEDHGTSASKLAAEIGINRNTLGRWLNGTVAPLLPAAQALAARLDTTVDALWPPQKKGKR
jgi:DNA-binding XRE family transcriptional regulator